MLIRLCVLACLLLLLDSTHGLFKSNRETAPLAAGGGGGGNARIVKRQQPGYVFKSKAQLARLRAQRRDAQLERLEGAESRHAPPSPALGRHGNSTRSGDSDARIAENDVKMAANDVKMAAIKVKMAGNDVKMAGNEVKVSSSSEFFPPLDLEEPRQQRIPLQEYGRKLRVRAGNALDPLAVRYAGAERSERTARPLHGDLERERDEHMEVAFSRPHTESNKPGTPRHVTMIRRGSRRVEVPDAADAPDAKASSTGYSLAQRTREQIGVAKKNAVAKPVGVGVGKAGQRTQKALASSSPKPIPTETSTPTSEPTPIDTGVTVPVRVPVPAGKILSTAVVTSVSLLGEEQEGRPISKETHAVSYSMRAPGDAKDSVLPAPVGGGDASPRSPSNAVGTTPNSVGTTPNSVGTTPNSVGTTPNSVGTTPNSVGTTPNSVGTTPTTEDSVLRIPTATEDTVSTTPTKQEDKVSRIPTSTENKVPRIPTTTEDTVSRKPRTEEDSVPRIPSKQEDSVPRKPSTTEEKVRRIPTTEDTVSTISSKQEDKVSRKHITITENSVSRKPTTTEDTVSRKPRTEEDSVPRIPTTTEHSVPRIPTTTEDSVPRTPTTTEDSVPRIPTTTEDSVPRTQATTEVTVPTTLSISSEASVSKIPSTTAQSTSTADPPETDVPDEVKLNLRDGITRSTTPAGYAANHRPAHRTTEVAEIARGKETVDKGGVTVDKGGVTVERGGVTVDKGGVTVDKGGVTVDGGGVMVDGGGVTVDKGGVTVDGGGVMVDGGGVTVDKGGVTVDKGGVTVDGGGVMVDGGGVTVDKGGVTVDKGGVTVDGGEVTLEAVRSVIANAGAAATPPPEGAGEGAGEDAGEGDVSGVAVAAFAALPVVVAAILLAVKFFVARRKKIWESEKSPLTFVSSSEWEFPRSKLRLQTVLGQGNFGLVYKAEADDILGERATRLVAVKTVKDSASSREKDDLMRELAILKQLGSHSNVVTLLGCCTDKEPSLLILEYVMYGKLLTFLRDHRTRTQYYNFSEETAELTATDLTSFAYCVARGMDYLSSKGIIHRDLAARNVLVDHNKVCKVADFGMSRSVSEPDQIYEQPPSKGALPVRWMAPESLQRRVFTHKSDVWAFGILMWEIVTLGSTPYQSLSAREVIRQVRSGLRLSRPAHCRAELYLVAVTCWAHEPAQRPAFAGIKQQLAALLDQPPPQQPYVDLAGYIESITPQPDNTQHAV